MPDDFSISLGHKDFRFEESLDTRYIEQNLFVSATGDVVITCSDDPFHPGRKVQVGFSPRAIATFLFGGMALSPAQVCRELNERRNRLADEIPRLLQDSLSRECCWPDAWKRDPVWAESEFTVSLADADYDSFSQRCGEFDLKGLRWRITRSGIEISDMVLCEHFSTQEEWERDYYGDAEPQESEEERYDLYREELEEAAWPCSHVRFSLKMSFAFLTEILVLRAEAGLKEMPEISFHDESFQRWTDIYATLTMIMARLPSGQATSGFKKMSPEGILAETGPLTTSFGKGKWLSGRRTLGKYNRPLTRKYEGHDLA